MSKIKAFVWDVDVCLVDTHIARKTVQRNFLLSCGISEEKIEEMIKAWERLFWYFDENKISLILSILRKQFKCENQITDKKISFMDSQYDSLFFNVLKITDGANEVLDFCVQNNIPMGIVSNGEAEFQWKKLHLLDIAKYFSMKAQVVVKDSTHGKPLPDGILECCKTIGVEPEETAFVGDRIADVVAANLAGCISIQYMQKAPEAREPEGKLLDIEKPTIQIKDLREILPLL